MNERVLECVYAALDEANEDRDERPPLPKSLDTEIHGGKGNLDSLQLINFLVAVEEGVEREFRVQVPLTDDRVLVREPNPIESVRTLVDYIEELLGERRS